MAFEFKVAELKIHIPETPVIAPATGNALTVKAPDILLLVPQVLLAIQ